VTIEELIARLEAADGPSRELEFRIARDVLDGEPFGHAAGLPDELMLAQAQFGCWPRYTSSIDAALSLVPEGHFWGLYSSGMAYVKPDADGVQERHLSDGVTPAIALCIAALKARAAT
jgi:hypothetical protein